MGPAQAGYVEGSTFLTYGHEGQSVCQRRRERSPRGIRDLEMVRDARCEHLYTNRCPCVAGQTRSGSLGFDSFDPSVTYSRIGWSENCWLSITKLVIQFVSTRCRIMLTVWRREFPGAWHLLVSPRFSPKRRPQAGIHLYLWSQRCCTVWQSASWFSP